MAKEIKSVLVRSQSTILGDAIGVAALAVLLYVGLVLPSLF